MKNQIKTVLLFAAVIVLLISCTEEASQAVNKAVSRPSAPILSSTVTIGTQVWMTSNLNVSMYRDGTAIPQVTNPTQWLNLTTGAWCYYENNTANGPVYGKLYNWYAVAGIYDAASAANPTLRKTLAPTGYHVPSKTEWTTLVTFLGTDFVAGGKMKAVGTLHWISPNSGATNSSGFTGLPGGCRRGVSLFYDIGYTGSWWSSTEFSTSDAWYRYVSHYNSRANQSYNTKDYAYSVRCLRD